MEQSDFHALALEGLQGTWRRQQCLEIKFVSEHLKSFAVPAELLITSRIVMKDQG